MTGLSFDSPATSLSLPEHLGVPDAAVRCEFDGFVREWKESCFWGGGESTSEQFGGSETTEPAYLPADFGIGERFGSFADSRLHTGLFKSSRSSFSLCTHGIR